MKKRIAIILELKNRELPYFVLLKEMLERQGHVVKIISFRSACSAQLLLFRPNVVLVNGLRSYDSYIKQIYIPKKLFGSVIACLYSEQIVYSKQGSIAETYNNPQIIESIDYHITWGRTFADALLQIGVPANKIWVLGSLQNGLKYYMAHTIEDQKKIFGELYGLDPSKRWSIIADNVVPGMDGADYNENRKWMNSLINKISHEDPNVEFILRLHPETPANLQKDEEFLMSELKNVHIVNEGHIYIWSLLCQNMIIAFSTSSITSLLNGKNVFSLKLPNAIKSKEVYEKYYWNRNIMQVYENIEDCAADIHEDLKGCYVPNDKLKNRSDEFITGFYYKIDKYIFDRYLYFFDYIPREGEMIKKNEFLSAIKYLALDLRGWIGEKLLRKQKVNNVVLKNDVEDVHQIYQTRIGITAMKLVENIYHYIEPEELINEQ